MKPQEQRGRARVRMELPVRIRQIEPPNDSEEVITSLDVSRHGVLFRTREPYRLNSNVWVTMPYHPDAGPNNLEFPASVVRIDPSADGFSEVAVQFHSARAHAGRAAYQPPPGSAPPRGRERRASSNRVRMTLPIRVPGKQAPEEGVTVDVSRTGVLFSSSRQFPVGEQVWVMMPYQPGAPLEEVPAQVIRNVEQPYGTHVALHYMSAAAKPASSGAYYAR